MKEITFFANPGCCLVQSAQLWTDRNRADDQDPFYPRQRPPSCLGLGEENTRLPSEQAEAVRETVHGVVGLGQSRSMLHSVRTSRNLGDESFLPQAATRQTIDCISQLQGKFKKQNNKQKSTMYSKPKECVKTSLDFAIYTVFLLHIPK